MKKLWPLLLAACATCFANSQQDDRNAYREITPNAGPRVTDSNDVYVTADLLVWVAKQEGLTIARSGVRSEGLFAAGVLGGTIPPNMDVTAQGRTEFLDQDINPGFKVGLGLDLSHDGWDTILEYTWLHSNRFGELYSVGSQNDGLTSGSDAVLSLQDEDGLTFNHIKGNWSLHFNNFTWELGRNFYVSQYLTLRPHMGLMGGWYRQFYSTTLTGFIPYGTIAPGADTSVFRDMNVHNHQKFWWLGMRSGLDTSYFLSRNWSLFGNFALSANWGRYSVTRTDNFTTNTPEATTQLTNTKAQTHAMKAVLETQIGLGYDFWWSDDEYHFGVSAAWEGQVWFNQNQFIAKYISQQNGDLIFQGLTLRFRFDF